MSVTLHDNDPSRWTPATGHVLRRAVTLAGGRPIDIATIIEALDAGVPSAPTTTLRLGLDAYGVLQAAAHLRVSAERSQVHLVDLVAALADAAFTHPDPKLVARRQFLAERLISLNGGSPAAASGLIAITDLFAQTPSSLVSR